METTIYVSDCTPNQMINLFDNEENNIKNKRKQKWK